jgi:predicted ATPase
VKIVPIQTVTIEGFRAIRRATIPLHPQVTVFFGPNAAGKSTVVDALAIGLGALAARVPKAVGRGFRAGDLRVPFVDRPKVQEKKGVERPFARVTVPNDQQLEHLLAKSGGAGRSLDYQNVMVCCCGGTWRDGAAG